MKFYHFIVYPEKFVVIKQRFRTSLIGLSELSLASGKSNVRVTSLALDFDKIPNCKGISMPSASFVLKDV